MRIRPGAVSECSIRKNKIHHNIYGIMEAGSPSNDLNKEMVAKMTASATFLRMAKATGIAAHMVPSILIPSAFLGSFVAWVAIRGL